jgi:hypothetical protein
MTLSTRQIDKPTVGEIERRRAALLCVEMRTLGEERCLEDFARILSCTRRHTAATYTGSVSRS